MSTPDLIALLAEAQTEIINATDTGNPVAQRLAAAMRELEESQA